LFEILLTGGIIGLEFRDRTRIGEAGIPDAGMYKMYRFKYFYQLTYYSGKNVLLRDILPDFHKI
jgi:hypothetical protein